MRRLWNWQQDDWPDFKYNLEIFDSVEREFLLNSGLSIGLVSHVKDVEKKDLIITLLSEEAYKTSEIEGEFLDRESLQSSIKRHFGIKSLKDHNHPRENGIAEMMISLYHNYDETLTHEMLWNWHRMLMNGRRDIENIGGYRSHPEPMQIVSNEFQRAKVHFEAPPSSDVKSQMDKFIEWFNKSSNKLPALVKASITHLYFESIHPFEDGNGRIGRALVEKVLSQYLKQPTLIALSKIIQEKRKDYYYALEKQNKTNQINEWLEYFSKLILKAQQYTIREIEFLIEKTKFFDQIKDQINLRQNKVINRMLLEGRGGFEGGLSAKNYINLTKTTASTATRDLQELVEKKILVKKGVLKATRYFLPLDSLINNEI